MPDFSRVSRLPRFLSFFALVLMAVVFVLHPLSSCCILAPVLSPAAIFPQPCPLWFPSVAQLFGVCFRRLVVRFPPCFWLFSLLVPPRPCPGTMAVDRRQDGGRGTAEAPTGGCGLIFFGVKDDLDN